MAVSLRPVTEADIRKIYEWRNHPSVRANSFNSEIIEWNAHVGYWSKRLKDKESYSFIITSDNLDAGLARLDKKDDFYEVNILVAPEKQGQGVGAQAISALKQFAKKKGVLKLGARVKPGNAASQRIFEKNGFGGKYVFYECGL